MSEGTVPAAAPGLDLIGHLIDAGKIDTAHRDIYLHHALSLMAPLLPRTEFLKLKDYRKQADDLIGKSRLAVERNDWQTVRDYTARISYLRSTFLEREHLTAAAAEVYEPADVVIDPFSPGLSPFLASKGRSPVELHRKIIDIFQHLEAEDSGSRDFYARREAWFRSRRHAGIGSGGEEKTADPARLQRDALQAVEHGDVESLDRILQEMERAGVVVLSDQEGQKRPVDDRELLEPFPAAAVEAAKAAGMIEADVAAAPRVSDFLWSSAWQPNLAEPRSQEGHVRLAGTERELPVDIPDPFRDTLEMFMLHPFVNSGGVRYLPAMAAEKFLVEDFAENSPADEAPLVEMLGLPRRRGLARVSLELAFLQRGPDILRSRFGLDPCEFRLVCIPFDLFQRIGSEKGWGTEPQWTHFDGYQLVRGGGVRALVGGDARYGGVFDLCSISDFDEREGVIARFAIVRRKRMLAAG